MDSTTGLNVGQVVRSKAGRDKGRVFVIHTIVDEANILICDGSLRKLTSPKKKKIKHVIVYNTVLTEFADMLSGNKNMNDAFVRKLLEPFNQNVHNLIGVE